MAIYLNTDAALENYKKLIKSAYFIDKSMILDKNSKDLIVRCEGIYGRTEKDDGHARSVVIIDDNKYNLKPKNIGLHKAFNIN